MTAAAYPGSCRGCIQKSGASSSRGTRLKTGMSGERISNAAMRVNTHQSPIAPMPHNRMPSMCRITATPRLTDQPLSRGGQSGNPQRRREPHGRRRLQCRLAATEVPMSPVAHRPTTEAPAVASDGNHGTRRHWRSPSPAQGDVQEPA